MATRKTNPITEAPVTEPTPPSTEDFQAAVEAAVQRTLEAQRPKITTVRCKACWKFITVGAPNSTGMSAEGICFENCYSKGISLDYSYTLARRLNFGGYNGTQFFPGTAGVVATHLGVTLEDLLDETKLSQDDLAKAWDESVVKQGGPRRPRTPTELSAAEEIQKEELQRRKLRQLKTQRDTQVKTLAEANAKLEELDASIAELETALGASV